MLISVPPSDCARAREAASARLDGELVELEAAHLEAHLRSCLECRAYAGGLAAIADSLRSASLEQPAGTLFVASPRRSLRFERIATAAAVFAVATGSAFALGGFVGSHGSQRAADPARTQAASQLGTINQLGLAMVDGSDAAAPRPTRRVIGSY